MNTNAKAGQPARRPRAKALPAVPAIPSTVDGEKPKVSAKSVQPAPELAPAPVQGTQGKKRKRLAKAFTRPLDKVLRKAKEPVRERFTLLEAEYEQLVRTKKQLAAQGLSVKKSDLIRVGLVLLSTKTEEELRVLLGALPVLR